MPHKGQKKYYQEHRAEFLARSRKARLATYGLSLEEYDILLLAQGGVCAICGKSQSGKRKMRLCVDHSHKTGQVRGLLCEKCNVGLGSFRDDPELLVRAARYLSGGFT